MINQIQTLGLPVAGDPSRSPYLTLINSGFVGISVPSEATSANPWLNRFGYYGIHDDTLAAHSWNFCWWALFQPAERTAQRSVPTPSPAPFSNWRDLLESLSWW
jgi:hypothetical protein